MKCYISILLTFFVMTLSGQVIRELSPMMQMDIKKSGDELRNIFISGNELDIVLAEEEGEIKVFGKVGEFTFIQAAPAGIEFLLKRGGLDYIGINPSQGVPLNDLMISNNNILPVHQGIAPIGESLTGEGVIMGIIDTGIELLHPDFHHEDGTTRILELWDHTYTYDEEHTPEPYGYGTVWTGAEINNGVAIHEDQAQWYGHGSTVTGTACGNGSALDNYKGVAPNAEMVVVSFDFGTPDFLGRVVQSIQYIFDIADEQGRPCVINTSLGQYYGSHDALDPEALFIDEMLEEQAGRLIVAAVGNSNTLSPYHLAVDIDDDTAFTWFEVENSLSVGGSGVFFELWADTASFSSLEFSMGADRTNGGYEARGTSSALQYEQTLGQIITRAIQNDSNQTLATVQYWGQLRGAQVQLQVLISSPDSSQYDYRFMATGTGKYDVWTTSSFGTSDMISSESLPTEAQFPEIVDYVSPDRDVHMVSSWTCSDKVITVGNYMNRIEYPNYAGGITTIEGIQGDISVTSSAGPTRDGRQKPDIAATGSVTLSSGNFPMLEYLIQNEPFKVAPGGLHFRNGGSSMASPVVAGLAALYLQQCPESSWSDFKSALLATAAVDGATGIVPNKFWGMGKLNGYGAIAMDAVTAELVQIGDTLIASGGETYTWFLDGEELVGSSGNAIEIMGAGNYQVEVLNAAGCSALSDEVLVTSVEEIGVMRISLSPNPTKGGVEVRGLLSDADIEIRDTYGKLVLSKRLLVTEATIDISSLRAGLYICTIADGDKTLIRKMVKE